ncbi:spermidine synthase [Mesorhizobium sp. BAC0120]|uniref:spermidine synthase n=1 Tax=Mesorhizobium sp. BAC0120 TaxID=3090670 RepID=UPI00298C0BA2|nr:spermidine synthase [Mesorhizobium sp. BAC0120]MDW6022882.1 spermidine synthase [Mesorhizobium sp. BAC0120]
MKQVATDAAGEADRRLAWPAVLLFGSGLSALIFQILWIKQLSVIIGVDIYAISAGVSAFFGGLAIGGLTLGRLADRTERPFLFYAELEAGVALLGVTVTWTLAHAAAWFAWLETIASPLAWSMVFALVGIPAILMGGTLPVLVRSLSASVGSVGGNGGRLYAANTFGAIAGALLASFLFIPAVGLRGTGFAAAVISVAAAAGALLMERKNVALPSKAAGSATPMSRDAVVAIALYSLAGGIALGYEVVWSQSIVQFMSTRTFAFSVVLATYLTGLAAGSAIYARWADKVRNPWGCFGLLISLAGLVALAEFAVLGEWLVVLQTYTERIALSLTGSELAGMCARFATAAAAIVLLPTVLLGAAFPAALRLIVAEGRVGQGVGMVAALNTIGGIAGTVLTGFFLVSHFGLIRTLAILAVAASLVGIAAATWGQQGRRLVAATLAAAVAACLTAIATPVDRLATLLPAARNGKLAFYEEGRGATVAVVEQQGGKGAFRRLYIQGVSNSGDSLPSLRYMRLQALLPLIIHGGEPRTALVIGLGTGITAGALLNVQDLDKRVVAELLPGVVRAASGFKGNYGASRDPRLEIRLRDGRRELLTSAEAHDLITLEPPPPSAAGVANLYSRDFYRLAGSRLARHGIVAQWLPLPTQNADDTRSLVKSFIEVFPYASLWTTELHEMLMIGSFEPMTLDLTTIQRRFAEPAVSAALSEVGIASPAALLATWIADETGLAAFAGDAPAVTDDRPSIEYAPWVRRDAFAPVLVALFALRHEVPVEGADADFMQELHRERDLLDTFYQAGIYAYVDDRRGWQMQMDKLMDAGGASNPYYEWFLGDRRTDDRP